MARVLQPAWEEEIMVPISPGSPILQPNIPHHMLMVCAAASCDLFNLWHAVLAANDVAAVSRSQRCASAVPEALFAYPL